MTYVTLSVAKSDAQFSTGSEQCDKFECVLHYLHTSKGLSHTDQYVIAGLMTISMDTDFLSTHEGKQRSDVCT